MADKNECRNLDVHNNYNEDLNTGVDMLGEVFKMQATLQSAFGFEYDPNRSLGELMAYNNVHHHGLQDEIREYFEALGGVDSDGSAVWKNWKKNHEAVQQKKLSDLTPDELLELQFEVVDMFKFWANMALSVGVDAKMFYNLFMAKTVENYDRIKRGY